MNEIQTESPFFLVIVTCCKGVAFRITVFGFQLAL